MRQLKKKNEKKNMYKNKKVRKKKQLLLMNAKQYKNRYDGSIVGYLVTRAHIPIHTDCVSNCLNYYYYY